MGFAKTIGASKMLILKNFFGFSFIAFLLFYKGHLQPVKVGVYDVTPQYAYSGVWQDIKEPMPKYFHVDSCKNCSISFSEKVWRIRPLAPGESILYYTEPQSKTQKQMRFTVIQFSDLVVKFLPPYGHHAPGDGGIHLRCYHEPDTDFERELARSISPSFEVFIFGINIYDKDNKLIFEGSDWGHTFSCENREVVIQHYEKKHKIEIVDIEILVPDGSLVSLEDTVVLERAVWHKY